MDRLSHLGERQKVCLKSSGLRCSLTHSSFRPQNFLVLVMMSLIPSSEGLEKSNSPACRGIIWDKSKKHGLEEVKFQSQFPVLCPSSKGQYYSLFVQSLIAKIKEKTFIIHTHVCIYVYEYNYIT